MKIHTKALSEFVQANYDHRRTVDSPMWLSYARMNLLGAWLAESYGGSLSGAFCAPDVVPYECAYESADGGALGGAFCVS